jgi:hypothetical protein
MVLAGTMWVTESSRNRLLEESVQESKPERVYESYAREEAEFEKMEGKERTNLKNPFVKLKRRVRKLESRSKHNRVYR